MKPSVVTVATLWVLVAVVWIASIPTASGQCRSCGGGDILKLLALVLIASAVLLAAWPQEDVPERSGRWLALGIVPAAMPFAYLFFAARFSLVGIALVGGLLGYAVLIRGKWSPGEAALLACVSAALSVGAFVVWVVVFASAIGGLDG